MLSVRLICVGKLKEKFYREACAEYEKRLKGYCRLEIVELAEQRLPERPSQAQIDAALAKEADAIRAKIPQGSAVIAMCIEGGELSSEQFAQKLRTAAAVHVPDDIPTPSGARHGAGTAVPRAQHRRGRKIS